MLKILQVTVWSYHSVMYMYIPDLLVLGLVGPKQEYHWCSSLSIQIVSRKRIGYLFFFLGGGGREAIEGYFCTLESEDICQKPECNKLRLLKVT